MLPSGFHVVPEDEKLELMSTGIVVDPSWGLLWLGRVSSGLSKKHCHPSDMWGGKRCVHVIKNILSAQVQMHR